jgi:hypothetical protein
MTTTLPAIPLTDSPRDWLQYRTRIRRCFDGGVVDQTEYYQLLLKSYDLELSPTTVGSKPSSEARRFLPVNGHRVILNGPRVREVSVLIVRLYPGITAADVTLALQQFGFGVKSPRPVEQIRKALDRETVGVMGRKPTLTVFLNRYRFIEGSLNNRTLSRWRYRFPTVKQTNYRPVS